MIKAISLALLVCVAYIGTEVCSPDWIKSCLHKSINNAIYIEQVRKRKEITDSVLDRMRMLPQIALNAKFRKTQRWKSEFEPTIFCLREIT